jgi:hypothetical protein
MQGHFDIHMLHTPGLTRELIEAVRREGGDPEVEKYIRSFQQDEEWHGDNIVFQGHPGYLYYYAMNAPSMYYSLNYASSVNAFYWVALTSSSTEPSYATVGTEHVWTGNIAPDSLPNLLGGSGGRKTFNQTIVDRDVKSDAGGREAIYAKFKWLYLPGECTSDQIKSIDVFYCCRIEDPSYYGGVGHARVARVRIKDSGGNPVTINKLATKSLLIEYTHTLVSL